jgi:hypothetical protein
MFTIIAVPGCTVPEAWHADMRGATAGKGLPVVP